MDGWMFFAFTCRKFYLCVYIYIFIFQLRVLFDIVMYTCILFIWQETKLETQKSNTLKSAFPINSDGSWSDLTNCSSNMGSKASSCCVVFFLGGGWKIFGLEACRNIFGCFMSLLLMLFHVFTFEVSSICFLNPYQTRRLPQEIQTFSKGAFLVCRDDRIW